MLFFLLRWLDCDPEVKEFCRNLSATAVRITYIQNLNRNARTNQASRPRQFWNGETCRNSRRRRCWLREWVQPRILWRSFGDRAGGWQHFRAKTCAQKAPLLRCGTQRDSKRDGSAFAGEQQQQRTATNSSFVADLSDERGGPDEEWAGGEEACRRWTGRQNQQNVMGRG